MIAGTVYVRFLANYFGSGYADHPGFQPVDKRPKPVVSEARRDDQKRTLAEKTCLSCI
jgi:hypothetical protein